MVGYTRTLKHRTARFWLCQGPPRADCARLGPMGFHPPIRGRYREARAQSPYPMTETPRLK